MQLGFWQQRWDEQRIGFHQLEGNPKLRHHFQEFKDWWCPAKSAWRVLVPLCGKTLDMAWLRAQGHEVIGIEFVEDAAQQFFAEAGVTPKKRELEIGTWYEHDGVSIIAADFFAVTPSLLGHIDMVYDRAALVAVQPERRAAYVAHLRSLLEPGSGLFLITFEHDIGSGPPFSIDNTEELLAPGFESERWSAKDILEEESRFRARGASEMQEVVWFCRTSD